MDKELIAQHKALENDDKSAFQKIEERKIIKDDHEEHPKNKDSFIEKYLDSEKYEHEHFELDDELNLSLYDDYW